MTHRIVVEQVVGDVFVECDFVNVCGVIGFVFGEGVDNGVNADMVLMSVILVVCACLVFVLMDCVV